MDDVEPVVEGVGLNLPPPAVDPDDPLLIAQTLTYVTDDGSVLLSFASAPFSFGKKRKFICYECIGLYKRTQHSLRAKHSSATQ